MEITYNGFVLKAAVEHLADSGQWTTRVLITRHHGSGVKEKFCSASNMFDDKAEAELRSIEFGKLVVDGHYQNATVADLF